MILDVDGDNDGIYDESSVGSLSDRILLNTIFPVDVQLVPDRIR
jgi:hypothetical protein